MIGFSGGIMRGRHMAQSQTATKRKKTPEEEKAEAIKGAAGRFGRAATTKAKTGEGAVEHLQRFGREELARKEAEKKAKSKGVEPTPGFIERMMARFGSSKKKDDTESKMRGHSMTMKKKRMSEGGGMEF